MLALRGIKQSIADTDAGHGFRFVTAGAGVLWTAALDEQLWRSEGEAYKRLRDTQAPVIHGFVLARNAIMHGAIVMTQDEATLPARLPVLFGPQWVQLDTLLEQWRPDGERTPGVQRRLKAYDELIAGRGVTEPLAEAASFFDSLEIGEWDIEEPDPAALG